MSQRESQTSLVSQELQYLLESMGASGAIDFGHIVHDMQGVIFMVDVHESTLHAGSFFGLCVGGVDLVRLSVVIKHALSQALKSRLNALVEDPTRMSEIHTIVLRFLQAIIGSGEQGLLGLCMIKMHDEDLCALVDLVHAQVSHPNRNMVLGVEGDIVGARGQMWERSTRGEKTEFLEALDAVFSILIAEADPQEAHLRDHVLRRPPIVDCDRDRPFGTDLHVPEPPWEDHEHLLHVAVQAVWAGVDKNHNDKLEVFEAREIFRLIASRPLFGLLVRSQVEPYQSSKYDQEEDEYLASRSKPSSWTAPRGKKDSVPADVRDAVALRSVFSAIMEVATTADEVTLACWSRLDVNHNETVTKEEFEDNFAIALQETIIDRVAEVATNRYIEGLAEAKLTLETRRRDEAEEQANAAQEERALARTTTPQEAHPKAKEAAGARVETAVVRVTPSPCNMDWLMDWIRLKGRSCTS
mmetsp:Transcript_94176/g.304744  ORF Transcript_94176/g.304744 Transcript_94176/m.304744 type:complete len:470 (-) Transcript_94176:203-1612(-)